MNSTTANIPKTTKSGGGRDLLIDRRTGCHDRGDQDQELKEDGPRAAPSVKSRNLTRDASTRLSVHPMAPDQPWLAAAAGADIGKRRSHAGLGSNPVATHGEWDEHRDERDRPHER